MGESFGCDGNNLNSLYGIPGFGGKSPCKTNKHVLEKAIDRRPSFPIGGGQVAPSSDGRFTDWSTIPIRLDPESFSWDAFEVWCRRRARLSPGTIEKYIGSLKGMASDPVLPLDPRNPSHIDFIDHMDYLEEVQKKKHDALNNRWKAWKILLKSYGIPYGEGTTYQYSPPPKMGKRIDRDLIPPEKVHALLYERRLARDEYTHQLLRHILAFSFFVGPRFPSEVCLLKLEDVDLHAGSIVITEKKKHYRKRKVFPLFQVINSRSHPSLRNYIEHWRIKVDPEGKQDALFLWKNGRPVSSEYLRNLVRRTVKPVWFDFSPYDCRRWSATAHLIESRLKTGVYDVKKVSFLLGHENPRTTSIYTRLADAYFETDRNGGGKGWIRRALRTPYQGEESTQIQPLNGEFVQNSKLSSPALLKEEPRTWRDTVTRFWSALWESCSKQCISPGVISGV